MKVKIIETFSAVHLEKEINKFLDKEDAKGSGIELIDIKFTACTPGSSELYAAMIIYK